MNQITQYELSKLVLNSLKFFDLSPCTKLVLMYLVDCFNPNKNTIYPLQKTVSEKLGLSLSSVKRAVKELSEKEIIEYQTDKQNRYKLSKAFFNEIFNTWGHIEPSKNFKRFNMTPKVVRFDSSKSFKLPPACINKEKEKKEEQPQSGFQQFQQSKGITASTQQATHTVFHQPLSFNNANNSRDQSVSKSDYRKNYNHNKQKGIKYLPFKPEKIEKSSPLDFTEKEAKEYLNNLPEFLQNSKFALQLRQKWNFLRQM